jgi:predicted ATPase
MPALRHDEQENEDFYDERSDDDLGKGRIRFSQKKLYGRDAELAQLHAVYTKLQACEDAMDHSFEDLGINGLSNNNTNTMTTKEKGVTRSSMMGGNSKYQSPGPNETQIVFLEGLSGTGKSALVEEFIKQLVSQDPSKKKKKSLGSSAEEPEKEESFSSQEPPSHLLVALGKYDELQSADPFSAITEAMTHMCSDLVRKSSNEELAILKKDLKEGVTEDGLFVVTSLMPDLELICGASEEGSVTVHPENIKREHAINRLKYVFVKFMKACCTWDRPMILFLDDLQWADEASLDLLWSLLMDRSMKHLLFIGAYRSNEVDEDHRLYDRIADLKSSKTEAVVQMEIKDLPIKVIMEFIADSLSLEGNEAEELAGVVYRKTAGNIFFARQALEELCRKNALYYDVICFRWEWNLSTEELDTALSDDVAAAVKSKIANLPERVQKALTIAAFTRATFDVKILKAFSEAEGHSYSSPDIVKMLDKAVRKGLLVHGKVSQEYTFAHDCIQQGASCFVAGDARDQLRVRIAKALMGLLTTVEDEGADWMLFAAADHLNSVPSHDMGSLVMAMLNLEAGEKSLAVSAMAAALAYFEKALQALHALDPNPWTSSHYDLCLSIHRVAADVALALGNIKVGFELSKTILEKAKTIEDKVPTYISYGLGLGRHEMHNDAMRVNREALYALGELPKSFVVVNVVRCFSVAKSRFKRYSDDDIARLPKMKNPKKLAAMELLYNLSIEGFMGGDFGTFILGVVLRVCMVFHEGICPQAAPAFAQFGLLLCAFGDQSGGSRMGRLANRIIDCTGGKHLEAIVIFLINGFIDCWAAPVPRTIQNLEVGYKSGLECGNSQHSTYNLVCFTSYHYIVGVKLSDVLKICNGAVEKAEQRKDAAMVSFMLPMHTLLVHLMGEAEGAPNWQEVDQLPEHGGGEVAIQLYLYRIQLAYYFGEIELAYRLYDRLHEMCKQDSSFPTMVQRNFFESLAASSMAQRTGKRRYASEARKLTKEMESLMKKRGQNGAHRCAIMKAECLRFKNKNVEKVKAAYDTAIDETHKSGYIQDEALAYELAGEYMKAHHDVTAYGYLAKARDLYARWGATGKVNQMMAKLDLQPSSLGPESSIGGKSTTSALADIVETKGHVNVSQVDLGMISPTISPSSGSSSRRQ